MSDAGDQPADEETIPLFPLSTVLFPGAPLPMQIFEERYRSLVRDLLELEPEQRRFGVVAIQAGSEAGMKLPQIFPVGCAAQVQRIDQLPDGRSTLVSYGAARFRLLEVDSESQPYLTGRVRWLEEPEGEPGVADALVPAVRVALAAYFDALITLTGGRFEATDFPDETTELSYLTAGALNPPAPRASSAPGACRHRHAPTHRSRPTAPGKAPDDRAPCGQCTRALPSTALPQLTRKAS